MTDSPDAISVLNELLGREEQALAPRLFESTMFVSRMTVDLSNWARRTARSNADHCAALTDLIIELGGEPAPRLGDLSSADLHFQGLGALVPRLERDAERLIRVYRAAAARLGAEPSASATVTRIQAEHESELADLRSLCALASTPAKA